MSITFITSSFKKSTVQQRNAVFSWKEAGIPFILIGPSDIPGASLNLNGILTEESLGFQGNSPLINDMLYKSSMFVNSSMLALINSDVIIEPDFKEKLDQIIQKHGTDIFLTSVRKDTQWRDPIDTKEKLLELYKSSWTWHQDGSADIFITSPILFKKFAEETGPFILGRKAWDNWIHIYFYAKGIPCYNASNQLPLWHQAHDYSHINIESFEKLPTNPSVNHNCHLLGNSVLKIGKGLGDIIRVKSVFPEP